ncbi:hypothetical protein ES332_A04G184400v1 [Gossypium tomentosum]|uniref:Uncharacterized protein n=1 Tax=Gossypium tomentosum TaxID=34277 RepID=A0A5D2R0F9_GOSTO|nr:hypothetical protein ES332_A04G184400v1 [Gossypium tomentosum]
MNHGCSVMVMIHNCLGKSKVNLVVLTMKFAMAMLMNLAHLFLSLVSCTIMSGISPQPGVIGWMDSCSPNWCDWLDRVCMYRIRVESVCICIWLRTHI